VSRAREIFELLRDSDKELEGFAEIYSMMAREDSWSLYRPTVQNDIVTTLLAMTWHVVLEKKGLIGVEDTSIVVRRFSQQLAVRCRFTAANDALKLRSMKSAECQEWQRIRGHVSEGDYNDFAHRCWSQPTLFVIAGLGLVFSDDYCNGFRLKVTETAVEMPRSEILRHISAPDHEACHVRLPLAFAAGTPRLEAIAAIARNNLGRAKRSAALPGLLGWGQPSSGEGTPDQGALFN
jgi:hypothetical protein